MSSIKQLTPEQESRFDEFVQKWLKIGLSTEEMNVKAALSAFKTAYENVGLTFPNKYEVYDSPFASIKGMKEKYNIDVTVNDFIYGCHEASWLSFYDYYNQVVGINIEKKIAPLNEVSKHVGWCLLYDELIVLTSKPQTLKFDADRRAHCEDGYAHTFPDGTGVACWHGQIIPKEWIFDKSSLTPDVLLHWKDVHQRRAACEIIGWANVLKLLNATTVDEDVDPTIGTLVEVDLPDSGKERFLLALDPNVDRIVGLSVLLEHETALEANSWTYDIDKFEFKPDFRV